jgi:hypothetical protein
MSVRMISDPLATFTAEEHTVQIVCCHQQLQAQLNGYIHVRNTALIFVFLVVAKIFANLFEDNAASKIVSIGPRTLHHMSPVGGVDSSSGYGLDEFMYMNSPYIQNTAAANSLGKLV